MSGGGLDWRPIGIAAGAAVLVAAVGGTLTDVGPWYQSLDKPDWTPPDWLFPVAWTAIFACATLSAVQAWRATEGTMRDAVVGLFAANGFLNVLWSLLFFRMQRPDWAVIEVAVLWLSIAALIGLLWSRSRPAALLLVPYLLWVGVAAALNLEIVRRMGAFG
jgi:tryptophan-rich sensory protein